MKIDLVTFDWSGVISDDRLPVYRANTALLERYGKPTMSFEEWLPLTRLSAAEFLNQQGVEGVPEELNAQYKVEFDRAITKGIRPVVYADAQEALTLLRDQGKKMVVLSSHPATNLLQEAEIYGLKELFLFMRGGTRDKARGIREICQQLQTDKNRTLYVGDTIYDIRAAKEAGVNSAGVSTGYHLKERLQQEQPDILVSSLSELEQLLRTA